MTIDSLVLIKVSDLQQVTRREKAQAIAGALAKQAPPEPVGALTPKQPAKFLGVGKTRLRDWLPHGEHPPARGAFQENVQFRPPRSGSTGRRREEAFEGFHQHTARMAIADLAASLLTFAIEDTDGLDNSVWTALVNEMRDEMIAMILGKEGDVPRPTWQ